MTGSILLATIFQNEADWNINSKRHFADKIRIIYNDITEIPWAGVTSYSFCFSWLYFKDKNIKLHCFRKYSHSERKQQQKKKQKKKNKKKKKKKKNKQKR